MEKNEAKKQAPALWGSTLAYKLVLGGLIVGFAIGIGIMLHPFLQRLIFSFKSVYLADRYQKTVNVDQMGPEEREANEREFQRALDYNSRHAANLIADPFTPGSIGPQSEEEYESLLDPMGNGMMGVIEIPRIGQRLCIYHGTDDRTLLRGVGHIAGSSLPVGGENSHCVLTGHRGLAAASLFSDLNLMEEGDEFYLHVLGHDLAYEVDQILTVLPEEISALAIVPGGDLVTLVTCTPYAVNSHRLLVRGHRVPYTAPASMPVADTMRWLTPLRLLVLGILLLALILLVLFLIRRKKKKEGQDEEEADTENTAKHERPAGPDEIRGDMDAGNG